jgi:beta-lactam-binding protein with PASTA domain
MAFRTRSPRRTRVDEDTAVQPVVEEDQYVPPRRPPFPPEEIWPWLLLLLLLVIGGLVAAFFLTRDNDHKHRATVPAVVGLKQQEAVGRLSDRGLVAQVSTRLSKFPAGTVFAQDPSSGTKVKRHSTVLLSVSAAAVTPVPKVVGLRTSAAVARLKAAGLSSQVTTVPAKAAAGVIVRESPAAGTKVAKSSTVSLQASKGQTTVPDVVGQAAADAKAALRTAGLVPVEFKVPGAQPKGTVTAQKPLANKKVARGSKVRINVSTGAAGGSTTTGTTTTTTTTATPTTTGTVSAPNVLRIQQSAAQRRLNGAGLRALVKYVPSQQPAGVVLGQSPAGGTKVKKGSRVRLGVSRGPNPTLTLVPNVVGKTKQAATSTLQNAGFKVQVLAVSNPSRRGMVVDEQPAGDTRAPDGSTITIYVGSG